MRYICLLFLFVSVVFSQEAYSQVDISNVLNNAETNISGPSGGDAEGGMENAIRDGDNWELSVHVHLLEEGLVSVYMDYYLPYAYIEVTTEAGYSGIGLINHHIPGVDHVSGSISDEVADAFNSFKNSLITSLADVMPQKFIDYIQNMDVESFFGGGQGRNMNAAERTFWHGHVLPIGYIMSEAIRSGIGGLREAVCALTFGYCCGDDLSSALTDNNCVLSVPEFNVFASEIQPLYNLPLVALATNFTWTAASLASYFYIGIDPCVGDAVVSEVYTLSDVNVAEVLGRFLASFLTFVPYAGDKLSDAVEPYIAGAFEQLGHLLGEAGSYLWRQINDAVGSITGGQEDLNSLLSQAGEYAQLGLGIVFGMCSGTWGNMIPYNGSSFNPENEIASASMAAWRTWLWSNITGTGVLGVLFTNPDASRKYLYKMSPVYPRYGAIGSARVGYDQTLGQMGVKAYAPSQNSKNRTYGYLLWKHYHCVIVSCGGGGG